MSAIGTKRTSLIAAHMSAFRGKADMVFCGKSAFAVAIGVKRTSLIAAHMSANDPKLTSLFPFDLSQRVLRSMRARSRANTPILLFYGAGSLRYETQSQRACGRGSTRT
jgi:hypothetical protein